LNPNAAAAASHLHNDMNTPNTMNASGTRPDGKPIRGDLQPNFFCNTLPVLLLTWVYERNSGKNLNLKPQLTASNQQQ
jgi:hypothetical protein